MKAYMGWDGAGDPSDGAALIFAHNAKEAKKVFWNSCAGSIAGERYIDSQVTWLRDRPWLFDEMPVSAEVGDKPCVLDSPRSCRCCGCWGHEPIGKDERCDTCRAGDCDTTHHI